ncbi:FAD-dependent oxidoreductase [Microbacterium karelineae]|uniref:FAD-dependent oxidoreductase n=1 Tax=Microbacterium karelineae TaxID=2654283 RepID=UPI0012EAEC96|nr:NAD(P)/FAD-dependent oxidoreductase [Microbacterium karelineae]
MHSPEHDVVVIGAGPAGLLMASELHRRGLDVALLERRPVAGPGSRAIGVHPPTLGALEASGATERILAEAVRIRRGIARSGDRVLGEVRFDRLPLRFPFIATLPQASTEAAIAAGAPAPMRGVRATAVEDRGRLVMIRSLAGGSETETSARFVVVAAGASGRWLLPASATARPHRYRDRYLMADVTDFAAPEDAAVVALDRGGVLESFPLPHGGRRIVAWDRALAPDGTSAADGNGAADDAERLRRAVEERAGGAAPPRHGIERASAFGIHRALAPRMRVGRVFVIGDAAHEVSPIGGQGMNLGLLDAATLAPILAERPGDAQEAGLDRWERARTASARTAARLAGLNTALGRPRPARSHRILAHAVGAALAGPLASIATRAYAMGLDRDAAFRSLP